MVRLLRREHDKAKFFSVIITVAVAVCLSAVSLILFGIHTTRTAVVTSVYCLTGLSLIAALVQIIVFKNPVKRVASDFVMSDFVLSLRKNRVFDKVFSDLRYRVSFMAFITLVGNLGFLIYLLVMAISHRSTWFASLIGVYAALYILRSAIVFADKRHVRHNGMKAQWIIFLIAGACLPLISGIMVAPIIQMVNGNYPKGGGLFSVVINSLFALIKIIIAVTGIAKSGNRRQPVVFALKSVNSVVALVSLFNLQISIIIAFANGYSMWELVTALGVLIAGSTMGLGVYMVIYAAVALKKRKYFEEDSDDGPSITIDDATLDKILSEASKADERNSLID